jgi:superoxide dismutase, Cu-Zn family
MKRLISQTVTPFILGGLLLGTGCERPEPFEDFDEDGVRVEEPVVEETLVEEELAQATAEVSPLNEREVRGQVTFQQVPEGTLVTARITGLDPDGLHGFHVHEGTDCEDPGEHLAPYPHVHGAPTDPRDERHKGDMGNLEADGDGLATYEKVLVGVTMDTPPTVIGHPVVVHEGPDDLETYPSGDSGDPIACGVIRLVD